MRTSESGTLAPTALEGSSVGHDDPVRVVPTTQPPNGMIRLSSIMSLRDTEWSQDARPEWAVVYSERGRHNGMSAESITVWFHRLYGGLGMDGCSSHSARRTFVTKAARKIVEAGGSH